MAVGAIDSCDISRAEMDRFGAPRGSKEAFLASKPPGGRR